MTLFLHRLKSFVNGLADIPDGMSIFKELSRGKQRLEGIRKGKAESISCRLCAARDV